MHVKYTGAVELPVLPAASCVGEDTSTETPGQGCRAGAERLCPKAWDGHHPAPQLPACWAALKLAQVRCQLLPCLLAAAAGDAGEGKAAKHEPSELGREMDVRLSSGIRVFTLNQRLAK